MPTATPSWRLNTLFVRYGCGTEARWLELRLSRVLIPYSSGMGVGLACRLSLHRKESLNTLFVRYGCGTLRIRLPQGSGGLNTLFVRYGCGTALPPHPRVRRGVLIPYSSGMGVGPRSAPEPTGVVCLNTLFVRYGCGNPVRRIGVLPI